MGADDIKETEHEDTQRGRAVNKQEEMDGESSSRQSGVSTPAESDGISYGSRWPSKTAIMNGHPAVIAAVLSAVFPGGGQFYTRQFQMGISILLLQVFNVLMVINRLNIGVVFGVFFWLYSVWNAYQVGWRRAES
jgi:TM2 domain-containing membrane protein YozV